MKPDALKKTALFLTGQTVTLFGSALVQYAISWHITLTTKSGLMLTAATVCGFLPQVLISLFAGVWADRFDRKRLIIAADAMIAAATAVLAVLFALGYDMLWLLFVISAVRSLGAGIQTPAVGAFLPDIVPAEHLARVNGVNAGIQGAMLLVAPIAAGGLYASVGLEAVFWVDVLTAMAGILLLALIKTARTEKSAAGQHVFLEMRECARYVAQTKWLWQFLGFYMFYSLMFGPVVFLTPLMVARSFGDEPWRLVAHEVVFAAGMTAGGLVAGAFAHKMRNKVLTTVAGCAVFGLLTLVMGFSFNFWFYLGVMLVMGLTVPFVNTGSMTVLQTNVRPDLMGRVFSLVSIVNAATLPLSMAMFGPMADSVSVEALLIGSGLMMFIISLAAASAKEMVAAGAPLEAGAA